MLTVETYIKHMDCFVKIEPDTDIELVTDVFLCRRGNCNKILYSRDYGIRTMGFN